MEYYTLSRYAYWKYYFLVLYYRLAEYPPAVRGWIIFGSIALILMVFLWIGNVRRLVRFQMRHRLSRQLSEKYYDRLRDIALTKRTLDLPEIVAILNLPKDYKMKRKLNRSYVPVLLKLYRNERQNMNKANWQRLMQALKMPAYFEEEVLSRSTRRRILAFKAVADLDANLKEAVASRYLYTKDRKLQNNARLHAARFGTSYPFKVLEEDPNLVFTDELVVKYHNLLVYRKENGLTMPNFIRWCNRTPLNEELRIFAVNEIRLFGQKEDCPALLSMLEQSHDEAFSCALIRALGDLDYVPAEKEFCRRYPSASFLERQVLADAIGTINSGSGEVLEFLADDFVQTTDYVTRMKLLRVIYYYGRQGRDLFYKLKASAGEETLPFFEHIECDLIDSRRYA